MFTVTENALYCVSTCFPPKYSLRQEIHWKIKEGLYLDVGVTGCEAVRKECGPKCTMLGKRDLFIRRTKDIKHNESNKDDQDGGGEPRSVTLYSHEGINTRT